MIKKLLDIRNFFQTNQTYKNVVLWIAMIVLFFLAFVFIGTWYIAYRKYANQNVLTIPDNDRTIQSYSLAYD